jgi:CelD/BcsL family acetyltransferase involved in cellulose biosynthesis
MIVTSLAEIDLRLSASIVRADEELQRLAPEWKELFRRVHCDNVFLSYEWLSQWWTHFGQGHDLFVVIARDGRGCLTALAPMYISSQMRPLRIRRLGFLGDKWVGSDYLDFLADDVYMPAALDCISRHILNHRSEWHFIDVPCTRESSIAATALQDHLKNDGLTSHAARTSVAPYLSLPKSTDEYWAGLKPHLRKNLRNLSRSLKRDGDVEFVTITDSPEIERALDDVVRLHEARLDSRGTASAFVHPSVREFHRAALRSLSAAGWAHVHLLKFRGQPVAAIYGFSSGRTYFFYQSGFDPAYSRFSVGSQAISGVIEHAIRAGHTEFDFLRGNESYKRVWSNTSRQLHEIGLYDRRVRSRIAQTRRVVHEALSKSMVAMRSWTTSVSAKASAPAPRTVTQS